VKQAQQNPIIFNKSQQQGRRGDRGHELSNFPRTGRRVCLARGAEDYWLALHDSHRTHETRNLAAPRRARPRPRLAVSSSSRTLAHRTGRCARTAAPGASCRPWGRRSSARPGRRTSRSGANRASLSEGEPANSGARPFLPPAIAMCRCQADVNASAVVGVCLTAAAARPAVCPYPIRSVSREWTWYW
jgi:hypothetical protein